MEYRIHPKTGARVSVIGIGTGPIHEATEREAAAALSYAYEQGVNYLDFATAGAGTFPYVGAVLGPVRMDYPRVASVLQYMAGQVGQHLTVLMRDE